MRYDSVGVVTQVQRLASECPRASAAFHRDEVLTYNDLHDRSVRLAQALREHGVGAGSIVAICVRPGFDILVGLLAIFRCQAIYLTLDPDHPHGHLQMILDDAAPHILLKHSDNIRLSELGCEITLDLDTFNYSEMFTTNNPADARDRDDEHAPQVLPTPAYLMYTSGTTGAPKGVLISNSNLHFYLSAAQNAFRFRAGDIFCNVARYTFSISLFDLLLPLCTGGAVRLVDREDVVNFHKLIGHLQRSTVFHAGPSLLSTLFRYVAESAERLDPFANIRHLSTGGDIVLPVVMQAMQTHCPHAELFVIYGSTEISCMGTLYRVDGESPPAIPLVGSAFPGMMTFLRNEQGFAIDDDSIGEICFAGDGVGIGYLNQPQLSLERFGSDPERRIYTTGDFGRRTANGAIEMTGRRDFQAKLRGVRIELTAIENRIVALGCAAQCVVVLRNRHRSEPGSDDRDSGFLVAFLVGSKESVGVIRRQLAEFVPQEMMPSIFIKLDAMPVTFNGKLDRKQLIMRPIEEDRNLNDGEEKSFVEISVADIFCALLGLSSVGLDENFFDLGGHSLLAILLLAEIERTIDIPITPQIFFESPTIRSIARAAQSNAQIASPSETQTTSRSFHGCSVVRLSGTTGKQPIFFLSGVHIYRALARRLVEDWSVYGIISERELAADQRGKVSDPVTVEALASDYVASILKHQNHGPYHILGYSFAGILAFEVAKQLTAMGHQVERLFLVDSTLPEWILRGRYQLDQLARLVRTSPSLLLPYYWNKIKKQGQKLRVWFARVRHSESPVLSQDSAKTQVELRLSDIEKQRGHRNRLYAEEYMKSIKRYPGDVTLFVAGKRLAKKPLRSQSCGWQSYTQYLKTIRLNADHTDVLEDSESLARIASEIKH